MLSGQGVVTQGGSASAQKTNNKGKSIGRIRFMAGSYHFVVALWSAKEADCARRDGLGNDNSNLGSASNVTHSG
jgi:hypothetical protein